MTKEVIVKTQNDLDKIKLDFSGEIIIKDTTEAVSIRNAYPNAYVKVCGSARIDSVYGSARIGYVSDSASIGSVYGSARIGYVYGSARIDSVYGSARIGYVYGSASIGSVYGSARIGSVYGSARIDSMYGSASIGYVYGSARIDSVSDSASIGSVYGSASIGSVSDSASIGSVYGSASIGYVYGSARIDSVYGSASIGSVYGSARIDSVYGSARIGYVYGSASILLITALATVTLIKSAKEVHLKGSAFVRYLKGAKKAIKIESKKAIAIEYIESEDRDWEWYEDNYPVIVKRGKAVLYKSVHKKDGKYFSDYDKSFPYEIGKTYKHECYPRERLSCSVGLHVAHKYWAVGFGAGWSDRALLECEVPVKDIVVCDDCDGKVRTPTLKVVKEVAWE